MIKKTSILFMLFGALAIGMPSCSGDSKTDETEQHEGENHDHSGEGHNHNEDSAHHEGDGHNH